MRATLLTVLIFFSLSVFSQGYNRKNKDAFPQQPRYEKKFWYFDLGATYTLPLINKKEIEGTQIADTLYRTQISQNGKVGAYAAFGRYHMINNYYFLRYWNYGISYRWLKGTETYTDELVVAGNPNTLNTGENAFSDHYLGMHIELNGRNKLSDNSFLSHGLGLNASYAVGSKRSYTHSVPGIEEKTQSKIHGYLYYKLGWGIRANRKLLVIPTIEVPIMNLYSWNNVRADMPYFNSNYWPLTFSIRFMLCQPYRQKSCPPVDAIGVPEGYNDDGSQKKK
jgi:hypothetical protein